MAKSNLEYENVWGFVDDVMFPALHGDGHHDGFAWGSGQDSSALSVYADRGWCRGSSTEVA